ncbi:hypothetical protein L195_g050097, partial [Trifolium pratense]
MPSRGQHYFSLSKDSIFALRFKNLVLQHSVLYG